MNSNAVIVTGGAGYIGSHTCRLLASEGFHPISYDNLSNGRVSAVQWGPFIHGDLSETSHLEQIFLKYKPIGVIHFGGLIQAGESVDHPEKYFRNNLIGSMCLLEAVKKAQVPNFVFSSSAAVYGNPSQIPIPETHPKNPINPYGHTKLMFENILAEYSRAYGLKSIALRYFNAAGAAEDGSIGENHNPETHLIPLVLRAAIGLNPTVTIMGNDYKTPDGTCVRDYVHVNDLGKAHILALNQLISGMTFGQFNLANSRGYSVKEVINCAQKVTGKSIATIQGKRRPGDPDQLIGDSTLARKMLGWKPEKPDLSTMIESAWNYLKLHTD